MVGFGSQLRCSPPLFRALCGTTRLHPLQTRCSASHASTPAQSTAHCPRREIPQLSGVTRALLPIWHVTLSYLSSDSPPRITSRGSQLFTVFHNSHWATTIISLRLTSSQHSQTALVYLPPGSATSRPCLRLPQMLR